MNSNGVVVGVTDFTGSCAVAGSACTGKASAQGLMVVVANLNPLGTASPVGPGSYPVSRVGSIPLA